MPKKALTKAPPPRQDNAVKSTRRPLSGKLKSEYLECRSGPKDHGDLCHVTEIRRRWNHNVIPRSSNQLSQKGPPDGPFFHYHSWFNAPSRNELRWAAIPSSFSPLATILSASSGNGR